MTSFLLAMTMYPEVQKKIQDEIDANVGTDRLPTFADRDSLPYLATTLKEVIRWGPTTPLGAPHCVEQDDVHNGYFIPKGSIIMANIWYVNARVRACVRTLLTTLRNRHFMHDPDVYKDPMNFNPDRLIAQPGKPAEPDPFDFAFGYGRR
jgi:cytochrome P450